MSFSLTQQHTAICVARQERKQHKHTTNTHYAHEDDKIDISKLNQIKLN